MSDLPPPNSDYLPSPDASEWDIYTLCVVAIVIAVIALVPLVLILLLRSRSNSQGSRGLYLVKGLTESQSNLLQDFIDSHRHNLSFYGQMLRFVPAELLERDSWRMINLGSNLLENIPPEEDLWRHQANFLFELLLSHNYLSQLPPALAVLQTLRGLLLMQNRFTEFPSVIHRLESLVTLDFSYNRLDFAQEGDSFRLPPALESLKLNNNKITKFPKSVFEGSTALTRLFLHSNKLEELPPSLTSCQRLRLLNLSNNFALFNNDGKNLYYPVTGNRYVKINNNSVNSERVYKWPHPLIQRDPHLMKTISQSENKENPNKSLLILATCKSLTRLNLSHCGITSLPIEFYDLTNLEDLILSNNFIDSLDSNIGNLRSLRLFEMNSNRLQSIPSEIWFLEKLDTLFLSSNFLSDFPEVPQNPDDPNANPSFLPNLIEIHLADNYLSELPLSLFYIPKLRRLNVSYNNSLKCIPRNIENLERLETLILTGCSLLKSDEEYCKRVSALHLDKDNEEKQEERKSLIEEAKEGSFPWLSILQIKTLRELFLSYTNITHIPKDLLEVNSPSLDLVEFGSANSWKTKPILTNNLLPSSSPLYVSEEEENLSLSSPTTQIQYRLSWGESHLQGKRRTMEDATSQSTIHLNLPPPPTESSEISAPYSSSEITADDITPHNEETLSPVVRYFGLFDGHGSAVVSIYTAAKFSGILQKCLEEEFAQNPLAVNWSQSALRRKVVRTAIQIAFDTLQKQVEQSSQLHAGTTAVIALFLTSNATENEDALSTELIIGNVGDSRAVLYTRMDDFVEVTRLSYDHRPEETCWDHLEDDDSSSDAKTEENSEQTEPVGKLEWERVALGGGFVSEDGRVQSQIAVSRGVGDIDLQPHVYPVSSFSSSPVFVRKNISSSAAESLDKFLLILACDGVWDVLEDTQAFTLLNYPLSLSSNLDNSKCTELATIVRDMAYAYHSTDNISCLVISF